MSTPPPELPGKGEKSVVVAVAEIVGMVVLGLAGIAALGWLGYWMILYENGPPH